MRTSKLILAGISMAAALAYASPAAADATTTVDMAHCGAGSLTDLNSSTGCVFNGNINENPDWATVAASYLNAQHAYNNYTDPDITLTPLADLDPGNLSGDGITITVDSGGLTGTWTADAGIFVDYIAIKASDSFIIFDLYGATSGTWSTAGLVNNGGQQPAISHLIFFGGAEGVPEPATWAMMLLGVGMIGSSMRRRNRKQARPTVLA
jgi:hypothetical protein